MTTIQLQHTNDELLTYAKKNNKLITKQNKNIPVQLYLSVAILLFITSTRAQH